MAALELLHSIPYQLRTFHIQIKHFVHYVYQNVYKIAAYEYLKYLYNENFLVTSFTNQPVSSLNWQSIPQSQRNKPLNIPCYFQRRLS